MFNVILTKTNGDQLYVGCDGSIVPLYTIAIAFRYEFDDYEDAENVKDNYIANHYQGEDAEGIRSIEVVQM